MACQDCGNTHSSDRCQIVNLRTDGTYLVPFQNGVAGEGVDLDRIVGAAEVNTRLQLDLDSRRIIYTGEHAERGTDSPDFLSIPTIASLISLQELSDVQSGLTTDGDLLSFDSSLSRWRPYTVPSGTVVTAVGIDVDGHLVKGNPVGDGGDLTSVPIGGGIVWSGPESSVPSGYHIKDGSEISRTVYADLFAIISTTFGAGNGTTTFNLPNAQGRTIVGKSAASAYFPSIGHTVGDELITLNVGQMPSHSHSVFDPGHSHGLTRDVAQTNNGTQRLQINGGGQAFGFGGSPIAPAGVGIGIYANGGSGSHDNIQPSIVELHIMRII